MLKKLFVLIGLIAMPLFAPITAHAALDLTTDLETVGDYGYGTSGGPQDLTQTIGTIISTVLGLLGIIFLILAVYAGFLWMTSQGSEEKTKKAKQILSTAVIGLVITLAAYAIADFVVGEALTATGNT